MTPAPQADEDFAPAQDALNRMRRAYDRGTGCHLTRAMIGALQVTVIGQMWDEPDPRLLDKEPSK